ncbi:hypothetical protein AMJ85_11670, partial [candidate division BRC1 bacterium SM23_51]
ALLKSWAEQHPRARNASFHLDPKTQRPTYRLRLDVPGVSEALIIAEQQGLDREVIERAQSLLPEGVYDLNRILLRLEEREKQLGEALAQAAERERAAAALRSQLETEREELQTRQRRLKREFLDEKEAWLREVRQEIEKRIAHLPSRDEILETKREVQAMQDDVRQEQRTLDRDAPFAPSAFERLKPGRRVRVEMLHDEGEIVAVDCERQRVTVAIRSVEVELTPDQLMLSDDESTPGLSPKGALALGKKPVALPDGESVPRDLDLHGLRVEEALARVDRYIDLALRRDLATVRLRHGRGTGALRRAIHEFLRQHQSVRSFALADEPDGGDGVTIVELK